MKRAGCIVIGLWLACVPCFGQSSFEGLTPGSSTRAEAERVLGRPIKQVSETLFEFGPKWSARKIYVQYGVGSAVVARIEVLLDNAVSPSDARLYFNIAAPGGDPFGGNSLHRSESLRRDVLSRQPAATRTRKSRLEEYFGEPFYTVLTHEGEAASSSVNQIGFYSRELFEAAVADLRRNATNATTQGDASSRGGGQARFIGCFKDTAAFDLNGYLERSPTNTPERCIAICRAKGFKYAGVQYGESCLCGNSYGKYGPADNCDYECTGDARQRCGGYSANSVYLTGTGRGR